MSDWKPWGKLKGGSFLVRKEKENHEIGKAEERIGIRCSGRNRCNGSFFAFKVKKRKISWPQSQSKEGGIDRNADT